MWRGRPPPPLYGARSRVPSTSPLPLVRDSLPGAVITVNCTDAGDGADADLITACPIIVKIFLSDPKDTKGGLVTLWSEDASHSSLAKKNPF